MSHENDTVQVCSHHHQAYHILSQESTLNMACTKFQSNMPEWLRLAQAAAAAHVSSHAGSRLRRPSVKASSVIKLHEVDVRQVPRATQHEVRCCQVPRLPRKVPRRHGRLTAPKRAIRSNPVSLSATPATQSAAAAQATNGAQVCHQIQSSVQPSVISATPAIKTKVDVSKCHAKCRGATGD